MNMDVTFDRICVLLNLTEVTHTYHLSYRHWSEDVCKVIRHHQYKSACIRCKIPNQHFHFLNYCNPHDDHITLNRILIKNADEYIVTEYGYAV